MLAELNTGLKTPTDHIGREINELLNRIHDELEGVAVAPYPDRNRGVVSQHSGTDLGAFARA